MKYPFDHSPKNTCCNLGCKYTTEKNGNCTKNNSLKKWLDNYNNIPIPFSLTESILNFFFKIVIIPYMAHILAIKIGQTNSEKI